MEFSKIINNRSTTKNVLMTAVGGAMLLGGSAAFAGNGNGNGNGDSYTLQGTCAFLPAARATEFHGNPDTAELRLGLAGNQWVVFDDVMRAYNLSQGHDPLQPAHRENNADGFTLADLDDDANKYFIELIPPGQVRKQIKSGCMLLGNDEERNFLPGNLQVDFDVFASTNYDLMQDLANNGFIDEAVPYIRNRLDLMVAAGNPKGIGNTDYDTFAIDPGADLTDPSDDLVGAANDDSAFDTQFDIIMDLMSGDVVASSLDHINEGIHNASNGYMKKVHNYIKASDRYVAIASYNDANGDNHDGTKKATEWVQIALAPVVTPMPGSPGALRLVSGDSGENHSTLDPTDPSVLETGHDMATFHDNKGAGACWKGPNGGAPHFCEIAVLNKANTHESRVHHVETPNGVVIDVETDGFIPVDVGYVWITELAFQINEAIEKGVPLTVTGMNGAELGDTAPALGIPNTGSVNGDKVYSLAHLATSKNEGDGRDFVNFIRSPDGQAPYVAGGFTGMKDQADLDGGRCYAAPVAGVSAWIPRTGPGSCDDWLDNGSF